MFTGRWGSGQTAEVSDPEATVPRVVLAAGTATGAGTAVALTAAVRALAELDADVVAIVGRPAPAVAPLQVTVRPSGRGAALLGELVGRGGADCYIGFADRLPLVGRGGRHQVLVVQNPHLYGRPDASWALAERAKFAVLAAWARRSVGRADRIVCSTGASRDSVVAATGVQAERVEVVPIPAIDIEVSKEKQPDHIGRLVAVGDRYPYKRTIDAVGAAAKFAARMGRTIELTLVGRDRDADTEAELAAAIAGASGVTVRMTGPLLHAEALAEMAAADVLLLTSMTETQGLPLVEAHAIGLPVVCRGIGPFLELGGDAVMAVPVDAAAAGFADALVSIDDRVERERLAAAGRALHPPGQSWDLVTMADLV